MTCASCMGRVERALKKVDGVGEVTVNLATERATVRYVPSLTGPEELKVAVRDSGYEMLEPQAGQQRHEAEQEAWAAELQDLLSAAKFSAVFAAPLLLPPRLDRLEAPLARHEHPGHDWHLGGLTSPACSSRWRLYSFLMIYFRSAPCTCPTRRARWSR